MPLNVVVHGLFAMVFDNKLNAQGNPLPLILMPPIVDMHAYGAGGWHFEQPLEQGACYQLRNVMSNTSLTLDRTKHQPLIHCPDHGAAKACGGTTCASGVPPYCTISLPYPDDILPWRKLSRGGLRSFYQPGAVVTANQLDNITAIPLIHVLTYKTFTTPTLQKLLPDGTTQTIWRYADRQDNLHLFADPPFDGLLTGHLLMATQAMDKLFSPSLGLDFDYQHVEGLATVPGDPPPGPGLNICEQLTIAEERAGVCSDLGKGGAPRNCGNLLIQNP
jgi:hypothetical protein